ncbi:MAG: hypothetical protein KDB04_15850, partial [Acidimicrobiales bacterium]|nr:hypothetical protein [Acidimicrobiales bacterium]
MSSTAARPERDDLHLSTPGTSERRARRWPLRVGLLAVGAIAVAAPMVAAEPASAPDVPVARRVAPAAAEPVREAAAPSAFADLGDLTLLSAVVAGQARTEVPPPPTTTTTTTTAPPTTTTTAAPAPAPAPAAEPL